MFGLVNLVGSALLLIVVLALVIMRPRGMNVTLPKKFTATCQGGRPSHEWMGGETYA